MKIVHLQTDTSQVVVKKTVKEQKHERCVLMVANQKIKDRQKVNKFASLLCQNN